VGDLATKEKEADSEPEKEEKPEPKQAGDAAPEKTEQVRKRKPRKGD